MQAIYQVHEPTIIHLQPRRDERIKLDVELIMG